MPEWTERMVGARMQVDQQFQDRIAASRFSNQQWGLIMTAVDWEIHRPDDPDEARLVADTAKLPDIIPEIERIQAQMGGPAGPSGPAGPAGGGTGGITGRLKSLFGSFSTGSNEGDRQAQVADAEQLVDEYTRELQMFLEEHERWEQIRSAAVDSEAE